MSTVEKVVAVAEMAPAFGLPAALETFELARSTFYYHQKHVISYEERHLHLKAVLMQIAREHPEYGYRRTTSELHDAHSQLVNHKVVQRLHGLWGLPLMRTVIPPRPSAVRVAIDEVGDRANLVAGLSAIAPFEVCYTDFSEIVYAAGKAQLIPLLDHDTKIVLGWGWVSGPTRNWRLRPGKKRKSF